MGHIQRPVFRQYQRIGTAHHFDTLLTDTGDFQTVFCFQPMLTVAGDGHQAFSAGYIQGFAVKEAPVGGDLADFHPGQHAVPVDEREDSRVLMHPVNHIRLTRFCVRAIFKYHPGTV